MTDKVDKIVEQYGDVWKSRAAFFSWLKGVIRRGWSTAPQKTKLLAKYRKQIPNPSERGKRHIWGADCSICKNTFPLKEIQIDHVTDETARLTEIEHIQECVEKLLLVTEEDLRVVCKECHSIVSHSQKMGCSFEEAAILKQIIAFGKLSAEEQAKELRKLKLPVDKLKSDRQNTYEQHIRCQEKKDV